MINNFSLQITKDFFFFRDSGGIGYYADQGLLCLTPFPGNPRI